MLYLFCHKNNDNTVGTSMPTIFLKLRNRHILRKILLTKTGEEIKSLNHPIIIRN